MTRKQAFIEIEGIAKKASEWGIEYGSLECSFMSLGADSLRFRVAQDRITDNPIAISGDTVRLLIYDIDEDGNPKGEPTVAFIGEVLDAGASDTAGNVRTGYECQNAWLYFERTTFYQDWLSLGSGSTLACLFLNTKVINSGIAAPGYPLPNGYPFNPGTKLITVGEQIAACVEWLNGLGAKIQLGQAAADVEPKLLKLPSTQKYDIKVWEAIRVGLEKAPDVISRFDYNTAPHPSVFFEKRNALTPVTLTLGKDISAASPSSRNSLITPAVHVIFISKPEVNGHIVGQNVTHQWYPRDDANPEDPEKDAFNRSLGRLKDNFLLDGSLTQTILLDGWKRTTQTVEFFGNALDPMTVSWWYEFAPKLNDIQHTKGEETILDTAVEIFPSNYEDGKWNATGWTVRDLSTGDFVREEILSSVWYRVREGQVPQWLIDSGKYAIHRVRFYAVIKSTEKRRNESKLTTKFEPVHFDCIITTCPPDSYTRETSFSPAEEIPEGLAEQVQKSLSQTYYEGSITIREQFPTGQVRIGNVVNLLGAKGETRFASMNAIVQRVIVNYDTGTTQVDFGLPRWLGVAELIDLFRISRTRIGWVAPTAMGDMQSLNEQDVTLGRGANDNMMPGDPMFTKFNVTSEQEPSTGAFLDGGTSENPPSATINWQGATVGKLSAGSDRGILSLYAASEVKAVLEAASTGGSLTINGDGGVVIDGAACNGKALYVRECEVCVNNVVKKAMVVMSDPY